MCDPIPIEHVHPQLQSALPGELCSEAVEILYGRELASGIVTDDLGEVDFYQVRDMASPRMFYLQFNARRSERPFASAPAEGRKLHLHDIAREGKQRYFTIALNGRPWALLANPWPFMPCHATLALVSETPEPQGLMTVEADRTRENIRLTLSDIVSLTKALKSFVTIYNGPEAGASLPNERHYQAFRLPRGLGHLPLRKHAVCHDDQISSSVSVIGLEEEYPIVVLRISGDEDFVVSESAEIMEHWFSVQGEAATCNLIGLLENGVVTVYVVPRNALFRRAPNFHGTLGALESSGVFVFTQKWELSAIRRRVNYEYLWRMLCAVRPPLALDTFGNYR